MMTNEEKNLMYQLWNENLRLKSNNNKKFAVWKYKENKTLTWGGEELVSASYYCSNCGHNEIAYCAGLPSKCEICRSPMIDYELYKRLYKVNDFISLKRLEIIDNE